MTLEDRQKNYKKGKLAEGVAAGYLRLKGYTILGERFKTRYGEIDLIAQRGDTVCFIEVKARGDAEKAMTAVTRNNQSRVANAARAFLAENENLANLNLRFDVIVVTPYTLPRHIEAAWVPDAMLGDL